MGKLEFYNNAWFLYRPSGGNTIGTGDYLSSVPNYDPKDYVGFGTLYPFKPTDRSEEIALVRDTAFLDGVTSQYTDPFANKVGLWTMDSNKDIRTSIFNQHSRDFKDGFNYNYGVVDALEPTSGHIDANGGNDAVKLENVQQGGYMSLYGGVSDSLISSFHFAAGSVPYIALSFECKEQGTSRVFYVTYYISSSGTVTRTDSNTEDVLSSIEVKDSNYGFKRLVYKGGVAQQPFTVTGTFIFPASASGVLGQAGDYVYLYGLQASYETIDVGYIKQEPTSPAYEATTFSKGGMHPNEPTIMYQRGCNEPVLLTSPHGSQSTGTMNSNRVYGNPDSSMAYSMVAGPRKHFNAYLSDAYRFVTTGSGVQSARFNVYKGYFTNITMQGNVLMDVFINKNHTSGLYLGVTDAYMNSNNEAVVFDLDNLTVNIPNPSAAEARIIDFSDNYLRLQVESKSVLNVVSDHFEVFVAQSPTDSQKGAYTGSKSFTLWNPSLVWLTDSYAQSDKQGLKLQNIPNRYAGSLYHALNNAEEQTHTRLITFVDTNQDGLFDISFGKFPVAVIDGEIVDGSTPTGINVSEGRLAFHYDSTNFIGYIYNNGVKIWEKSSFGTVGTPTGTTPVPTVVWAGLKESVVHYGSMTDSELTQITND